MSAPNVIPIALAVVENNPIRQLRAKPSSKTAAIKAKCAECFKLKQPLGSIKTAS